MRVTRQNDKLLDLFLMRGFAGGMPGAKNPRPTTEYGYRYGQ
jgi:hypothetical protein